MAAGNPPALGLSIGSTNLAAVTADNAVTRKPVLTLYRQRPPEVGVPSENPRLDEPGLVITDFVDRVGDTAGIVAADGSLHRSEALIADALRSLAYTATGGRPLPEHVAVAYPSHWESAAVDTLGAALSRVAEWSSRARPLVLVPDAAAAMVAARANPGIPAGGTIAVCDFGATGTSVTLMDSAGDYRSLAPTVRYYDFSGNLIDQALLTAVMGNLPGPRSFDPASTLASGSLTRLRGECRTAKEQLSSGTMTTLADELPGVHGDFRLTRAELDEVIREPLNNFLDLFEQTLAHNGIRDLAAVVTVGGGANIPLVTTTLSGRLRVPVVTRQRPQLTPAFGAALRAARHPVVAPVNPSTMENPAAPVAPTIAQRSASETPLAWPRRAESRIAAATGPAAPDTVARPPAQPEPLGVEAEPASPEPPEPAAEPKRVRWYRHPPTLAGIGATLLFALVGAAVAVAVHPRNDATTAPATVRSSAAPAPSAAPPPSPVQAQPAPPPPTTESAPANPTAQAETPPVAPEAEPPAGAEPAPVAAPIPRLPHAPAIPALPPIPGLNEPIPGLERINQILQEFGVGPIGR